MGQPSVDESQCFLTVKYRWRTCLSHDPADGKNGRFWRLGACRKMSQDSSSLENLNGVGKGMHGSVNAESRPLHPDDKYCRSRQVIWIQSKLHRSQWRRRRSRMAFEIATLRIVQRLSIVGDLSRPIQVRLQP